MLGRQHLRVAAQGAEQLGDDSTRFVGHAGDQEVLVEVASQETLELLVFGGHLSAEADQRRSAPDLVEGTHPGQTDLFGAGAGEISDERIDHTPDGFVDQAAIGDVRVTRLDVRQVTSEGAYFAQLLESEQARAQTVVDVVVVVRNLVGEIGQLRLQ